MFDSGAFDAPPVITTASDVRATRASVGSATDIVPPASFASLGSGVSDLLSLATAASSNSNNSISSTLERQAAIAATSAVQHDSEPLAASRIERFRALQVPTADIDTEWILRLQRELRAFDRIARANTPFSLTNHSKKELDMVSLIYVVNHLDEIAAQTARLLPYTTLVINAFSTAGRRRRNDIPHPVLVLLRTVRRAMRMRIVLIFDRRRCWVLCREKRIRWLH